MTLNVVITGAAGRISYALIPLILNGKVFGPDVRISLRLLDIEPATRILEGVRLEIQDSCFELLDELIATTIPTVAFRDANVAILLGGYPRGPGMERRDLIAKNAVGMRDQALALDQYASRDCKVLVVANPANTNCLVAINTVKNLPKENFSCLTRLDHERLRGLAAEKVNQHLQAWTPGKRVLPSDIRDVAILGNHSVTQVPFTDNATYRLDGVQHPLKDILSPCQDEITRRVQNRGAEILHSLGASSALSCAGAISRHLKDWLGPIPAVPELFSMGILSDSNPYGVPPGLVFSFPCRRVAGGTGIEVVGGLHISPAVQNQLDLSVAELLSEKADVELTLGALGTLSP